MKLENLIGLDLFEDALAKELKKQQKRRTKRTENQLELPFKEGWITQTPGIEDRGSSFFGRCISICSAATKCEIFLAPAVG
jgi:hypothetical protein